MPPFPLEFSQFIVFCAYIFFYLVFDVNFNFKSCYIWKFAALRQSHKYNFLSEIDSLVKGTLNLVFRYRCLSKLGVLVDSFCLSNRTQIHPKIVEHESSRKQNGAVFHVQVYKRSKNCLEGNLSCVIYNLYEV